ncbi:hypothetical protein PtA15_11A255 [Puccinia triticina]|uniref:Uncharacterized protein n=1 Tax=Puccinia triticina TaxID=208348 RepID=A0ABY7CY65_9BASI|nr:uncharacterized protein PtA15_11A255 [Puccinia triticina]WAQ89565.1 hypothetical protein PtA15_11A255 [Puccinia triticina]
MGHGWVGKPPLSPIVRELSAQFVHLNRAAQSNITLPLRRSIWNWIETYPNKYAALVRSNGRLKGAPEILFDVAQGPSESGKKRAYTWPMMAMHLAVCPKIVLKITVGDRNRFQVTARRPPSFVPSGRGPPLQHTGHLSHELNSRLASAAEINPDDLEMFVYLTVLLVNNQNPQPIRQAAMTVLRAYHQPSSAPTRPPDDPSCTSIPPGLKLPLGLRQTRAIFKYQG